MSPAIVASRYHDISCGHRVVGHEGKCSLLHGHNYRIHFCCSCYYNSSVLDSVGRVIDFSVMKSLLCMWLEENWDHKFLYWEQDPIVKAIIDTLHPVAGILPSLDDRNKIQESFVKVAFNPTAENMAKYLLEVIGPQQLSGTGIKLVKVIVEETRRCSVTVAI